MVGGDERVEEAVVNFGVEHCDALPVVGQDMGVGAWEAFDEALAAWPDQVGFPSYRGDIAMRRFGDGGTA